MTRTQYADHRQTAVKRNCHFKEELLYDAEKMPCLWEKYDDTNRLQEESSGAAPGITLLAAGTLRTILILRLSGLEIL